MARRGDGIGVEVGAGALRGVRLSADVPGRLAGAAEEALAGTDDAAVLDAFVRLAARLGGSDDVPAHLAWFPPDGAVRAIDVTGVAAAEVRARAGELDGVTTTATVAAGARQWLVATSWDHERAGRLAAIARQAGFAAASCEPAPLALARVMPSEPMICRRDGWVAVAVDGVARAAVGTPAPSSGPAELQVAELGPADVARLSDDGAAVRLAVDGLAGERFPRGRHEVGLVLTGDLYPPYPPDDVRAPARQAVALGAAVAAAGLAGRVRAVEPLASVSAGRADARRPWVVQRLADDDVVEHRRRPWWRRLLDAVRGRRRRTSQ